MVAEFTKAYQEEVNSLVLAAGGQKDEIEGKLAGVKRKIDGILNAIEDGLYQPSMKARLEELEAEKAHLTAKLDTSPALPTISVHPNMAELYRKRVEQLESLLSDPAQRDEAMELIRSMIEGIELTPRTDSGSMNASLRGDLARILSVCAAGTGNEKAPEAGLPGLSLSVVAGTGNSRERHSLMVAI